MKSPFQNSPISFLFFLSRFFFFSGCHFPWPAPGSAQPSCLEQLRAAEENVTGRHFPTLITPALAWPPARTGFGIAYSSLKILEPANCVASWWESQGTGGALCNTTRHLYPRNQPLGIWGPSRCPSGQGWGHRVQSDLAWLHTPSGGISSCWGDSGLLSRSIHPCNIPAAQRGPKAKCRAPMCL